MSSSNTVTFKPASGAAVVIDGSSTSAIFNIDGGDYFILDGSNAAGGSTRDCKVINRGSGQAVKFINGATYNTVKNLNLIANNTSTGTGVVLFSTTSSTSNAYNLLSSNTIGDSAGVLRSSTGVYMYGTTGSSTTNTANRIENNDVINFGNGTTAYGIWSASGNQQVKILGNRLRIPVKTGTTGTVEVIRFDNYSDSYLDTIAYNRIWNVNSTSATGTIIGINDYNQSTSSSITIHNNMVSVVADAGTITGIQLWPGTANVAMYYNSVYVGGNNPSASTTSYGLRIYGGTTLTLKNNILANNRVSTGTNTNQVLYRASSTDALTSDYNLLSINGASTALGYDGTVTRTSFTDWQTTGKDASSTAGIPRFIDPVGGDLHIATNKRTPVESHATPISGITTDIDGNTRNTTTPDIGADEGNFLAPLTHDAEALALVTPAIGGTVRAGSGFTPVGVISNAGTSSENSIPVHFRIIDLSNNSVVYEDVKTTGTLGTIGTQQTLTFATTGSVTGTTTISTAGSYRVQFWAQLSTDGDNTNDTITSTIAVKSPLTGSYTINQSGSGSRNYPSFTSAVNELSQLGISGSVSFQIAGGTYSTAETFPLTIGTIQGVSATNTVTFAPASGANVIIDGTSSLPIIDINGADYVTLDGSNNSGTSRNWKVINRGNSQALRFINGATYNTVKNMNLMANNTSTTIGVVSISTTTTAAGSNTYNILSANTIGDSAGVLRSGVGVYMSGTTGATTTNVANRIENNDIINFGNGATAYGIYSLSGNQQVKLLSNRIRIPIKTGATGSVDAIRFDNYSDNYQDTIAFNRIWDISTTSSTGTLIGINDYDQSSGNSLVIHGNVISVTADAGTLTGIQLWPGTGTTYMYNNSVYVSGNNTSSSTTSYTLRLYASTTLTSKNNILVNTRSSTGSNSNVVIYRASSTDLLTSDNNLLYASGSSTAYGYDGSSYRTSLGDWQSTGKDALSVSAPVTFLNAAGGDLHVDLVRLFVGESRGTPIAGLTTDIDGDTRDAVRPDIGADEGNFNGGGIRVTYPNGGEQFAVNYQLQMNFTTTRPMSIRAELSTDGGSTWTPKGTMNPTVTGTNSLIITTPDVVTSRATVRVISQLNGNEADTSDATFSLVRPVLAVVQPNGGERWVAGDTAKLIWNADFMPPTMASDVQYSTDGGSTWLPIKIGTFSSNRPATNSIDWVVPNTPTTRGIVRVVIQGSTIGDSSDALFTIIQQPSVVLQSPTGGERWFVGEKNTIRWTTTTTDYITLDYSTNGGTTWSEIAHRVPANIGSYDWTVPNALTSTAIVRITNYERARYRAQSGPFAILQSIITVLSPNGGEQYELNQPVTVNWTSQNASKVRIEYSADNGANWKRVAAGITGSLGTFTLTPPAIPTKLALIRVVDEDRPTASDVSDAPFQVLESKAIVIFSPAVGDEYPRGSVTSITWSAPRVQAVNIYYSANGGASWQTLATNVPTAQGNYIWNVPNANTTQGKIRIVETNGSLSVESGFFSIVDPVVPTLRVLAPNGGESYTSGDNIPILWTASNIPDRLTISYSSDGGASWTTIVSNVQPSAGQYSWSAPGTPSTSYRVRIASLNASDASDADFTVIKRLAPKVAVLTPNGGESLTVGATATITWTAEDVFGTFAVQYSVDNGTTWQDITSVPANAGGTGTYSYDWTVPNAPSTQTLVRVTAPPVGDVSDAVFEIKAKVIEPIRVTSPNGGEQWQARDMHMITWTAPSDVVNVKIDVSVNGGASWTSVIASTPNSGSYNWKVADVPNITQALVRVTDAADATRSDVSDATFQISPATSGVKIVAGETSGLKLLGNFPNPFASATDIRWIQADGADVTLRIFDANGAMANVVSIGRMEGGQQHYQLQAQELTSGVYHYELIVGGAAIRGVMMIVR